MILVAETEQDLQLFSAANLLSDCLRAQILFSFCQTANIAYQQALSIDPELNLWIKTQIVTNLQWKFGQFCC